MSESTSQHEERLLSLLRRGLDESDPAPADVTDFAKAALSWQTIDADLAQLTYDSIEESNACHGEGRCRCPHARLRVRRMDNRPRARSCHRSSYRADRAGGRW